MDCVPVPAFFYLFLRRGFHLREAGAWCLLREAGVTRRDEALAVLAEQLQVSAATARRILRRGAGRFWHQQGSTLQLATLAELWGDAAGESCVGLRQVLLVPRAAFQRAALLRAHLAIGALSRGRSRPTSVGYSANKLGVSRHTVTRYRQHLTAQGLLERQPQYVRMRTASPHTLAGFKPPGPAEFVRAGSIYRRKPDIIVLRNQQGETVDLLANSDRQPVQQYQPRQYFESTHALQAWQERGRAVADDAFIGVHSEGRIVEWEAYTFAAKKRAVDSTVSTTTIAPQNCTTPSTLDRKLGLYSHSPPGV